MVFKFVTAIHRIAIREADVSDGGLPEVHRLGFVAVDCWANFCGRGLMPRKRTLDVVI